MSKKKIIILVIIVIFFVAISAIVIKNNLKTYNKPVDNTIAFNETECPYTLDEIYKQIRTGSLGETEEESIKMGYVITHFYDYFNKETKLLVATKKECELYKGNDDDLIGTAKCKVLEYNYIDYDTYQKAMDFYDFAYLNDANKNRRLYYIAADHLVYNDISGAINIEYY